MTANVDLKALADKLSTRQRKIVQTNALNQKAHDKWSRIGRQVWGDVKQTGHYV